MKGWEDRLQSKVDSVLYKWMKASNKASTTPPECIEILEKNGIYSPTDRPGLPLRNDLREARKASGTKDSDCFMFYTNHLKIEQQRKFASWNIILRNPTDFEYKSLRIYHVLREIQDYQQTLALLLNYLDEIERVLPYSNTIKNSLLFSHMIHLRNLLLFFKNTRTKDDILYHHILGYKDEKYNLYDKYYVKTKYYNVINKNVPHLTESRTKKDQYESFTSDLYLYYFLSSENNINFHGIGETIRIFLLELKTGSFVPHEIHLEIENEFIKKLFSKVEFDNLQLLKLKDFIKVIETINDIFIVKTGNFEMTYNNIGN